MEHYQVLKSMWYKGYVFLFSKKGGKGFWSNHKCENKLNGMFAYANAFQSAHNIQCAALYQLALKEDADEALKEQHTVQEIDDRIQESKQIIKSL
jgi:outer membrane protein assembly factor BamE (lipoprotein component of BamABCDE complex)